MVEVPWPWLAPLLVAFATACGDAVDQPSGGEDATSGAEEKPLEPGSVVLVTLASARADALGCYGSERASTPHLDELAAESVLYTRAHSSVPLTLPAHATMMTGLYPVRHQVRADGLQPLHASAWTLAEAALESGAQTAAFVGTKVLSPLFGLDQGFEVYAAPSFPRDESPSAEVVARALEWLSERDRAREFFLWIELDDGRRPHAPPPEIWGAASPYDGEMTAADQALAPLLRALREDEGLGDALVAVVGDHGEALEEHDETGHGSFLYETTLRVPFLLRYPDGHRAGERSDELVGIVDVFPTLCEALGVASPPDVDGRSLYRRAAGGGRGLYLETVHGFLRRGWSPLVGWLDDERKYVHGTQSQLFDLAADPEEYDDRLEKEPARAEAAREAIARVAALPRLPRVTTADMDEPTQRRIYRVAVGPVTILDAPFPEPLEDTGLPGPIVAQHEIQRMQVGLQLMSTPADAELVFRDLFEHNPLNPRVAQQLGICLIQQHRHSEAVEFLEYALEFGPASVENNVRLGICMRVMEMPEEAIGYLEQALFLDPDDLYALGHMSDVLHQVGRAEDAKPYLQRFEELREERRRGR